MPLSSSRRSACRQADGRPCKARAVVVARSRAPEGCTFAPCHRASRSKAPQPEARHPTPLTACRSHLCSLAPLQQNFATCPDMWVAGKAPRRSPHTKPTPFRPCISPSGTCSAPAAHHHHLSEQPDCRVRSRADRPHARQPKKCVLCQQRQVGGRKAGWGCNPLVRAHNHWRAPAVQAPAPCATTCLDTSLPGPLLRAARPTTWR